MIKKITYLIFILFFITGCTARQDIPEETTPPIQSAIETNDEIIENDPKVMGTYILYYDGEKGSSGIMVVLGPSNELTMLIPRVNNVLQPYDGTYTASDGILSFNMLEIPTSPSGWFGHRNFDYKIDGDNLSLTHTDNSNDQKEKSNFTLKTIDTMKLVEVK